MLGCIWIDNGVVVFIILVINGKFLFGKFLNIFLWLFYIWFNVWLVNILFLIIFFLCGCVEIF